MALQAALWDALLSLKVQASVYVTVGGQQWLMADDTAAECMSTRWKRLWDTGGCCKQRIACWHMPTCDNMVLAS